MLDAPFFFCETGWPREGEIVLERGGAGGGAGDDTLGGWDRCICVWMYGCMCVCMYIHTYVCIYVCTHVYIYTHTKTHTKYICIYIYCSL